ncbi:MAG: hypothetical protein WCJ39_08585 [bacterium]
METKTWSVRINDETMGILETMISESGLGKKEFFELVVNSYDKLIPVDYPEVSSDVHELMAITSRMNRIYSDMLRRMSSHQKQRESELQEQCNLFTNELQQTKLVLENSAEQQQMLTGENLKLNEDIILMENQQKSLLQQSTCSHNLFLDYKSKYEDCILDQESFNSLEKKANALERQLNESFRTNEALKNEIEDLKSEYLKKINQVNDTADIEKSRLVLEIETKSHRILKECQEEYTAKTKELLSIIQSSQQTGSKKSTK